MNLINKIRVRIVQTRQMIAQLLAAPIEEFDEQKLKDAVAEYNILCSFFEGQNQEPK